ncbi:MAG: hypothetical protein ACUVT5_02685 [Candidatus Bathyarchaeales archaeon]
MIEVKLKAAVLLAILALVMSSFNVSDTNATDYLLGDVNHDGLVDMDDVLLFRLAWQSRIGDVNFDPHCDFHNDGIINIKDAIYIGRNWTTYLKARVYIMPETLNLKSKGNWIIAIVVLPKGFNAIDVNVSSVKLNGTIPASSKVSFCGKFPNVFVVKFSRQAVVLLIREKLGTKASVACKEFYTLTLTVSGKVGSLFAFSGSGTIRVIHLKNG